MTLTVLDASKGDVTIRLATAREQVTVSSKLLSFASPVFEAMLRPTFAEGIQLEKTGTTEFTLDDDHPEALVIVLKVIHHCTDDIPDYLDVGMIYIVALIVDKYDVVRPLVSWFKLWIQPFRGIAAKSPRYKEWFWISWVSRDAALFAETTRRLVLETKLDDDGEMVIKGKRITNTLPDRIMGRCTDL
ncbi:hypothetical protein BDD12DRAFT_800569 [Trichophaea hybrida]|nr:hypothetical protein BDD12DRAFT_800569 [Trichophaea hybrida]